MTVVLLQRGGDKENENEEEKNKGTRYNGTQTEEGMSGIEMHKMKEGKGEEHTDPDRDKGNNKVRRQL